MVGTRFRILHVQFYINLHEVTLKTSILFRDEETYFNNVNYLPKFTYQVVDSSCEYQF